MEKENIMKQKIISLTLIISLALSLSGCYLIPEMLEDSSNKITHVIGTSLPAPSGPVTPTADGYTFETYNTEMFCKVSSIAEASAAIDAAIADHLVGLVLDFSPFGEDYNPAKQFEHSCELTTHVSLSFAYSSRAPHILEVSIMYDSAAASKSTADPERDGCVNIASANDVINRVSFQADQRRGEDFDAFAIDMGDYPERSVYNSEELWWAVEQGFRPVFVIENSNAERIYNKAKDVLRNIISKDMNDFEKTLAIYEYIVSSVTYDHDTYADVDAIPAAENACYYLEGVFDYGKAVCDGKSKAFVLLCGIEGIASLREFGYNDRAAAGHAWNYVEIDGVWYCVDTTAGDLLMPLEDGISIFFGRSVEVIDYGAFLTTLDTNTEKYTPSGLWTAVTDTDLGLTRTSEVLTERRSETRVDSFADFTAMLKTVIDAGYTEFTLTVSISPEFIRNCVSGMFPMQENSFIRNLPSTLMNKAITELGLSRRLSYAIFIEYIDENDNYLYAVSLAPTAD